MTNLTKARTVKALRRGKRGRYSKPGQVLLDILITHFGTPTLLAKKLSQENTFSHEVFHKQDLVNWRSRGGVSIGEAYSIARILGCSPFALNYEGLSKIFCSEKKRTWEQAVRSCKFLSAEEIKQILSVGGPDE
jgi:hypothetical protein